MSVEMCKLFNPFFSTEHKQRAAPTWYLSSFNKDIYHYVGQDIVIHESIDSFGAVMWPAVSVWCHTRHLSQHLTYVMLGFLVVQALALCSFLDNNRETVNLQGKEVLELGAGTGLVTIVASLLGEQQQNTKHYKLYSHHLYCIYKYIYCVI